VVCIPSHRHPQQQQQQQQKQQVLDSTDIRTAAVVVTLRV
jgi:hypothetical protein